MSGFRRREFTLRSRWWWTEGRDGVEDRRAGVASDDWRDAELEPYGVAVEPGGGCEVRAAYEPWRVPGVRGSGDDRGWRGDSEPGVLYSGAGGEVCASGERKGGVDGGGWRERCGVCEAGQEEGAGGGEHNR